MNKTAALQKPRRLYDGEHCLLQFRRIFKHTPENHGENDSREAGPEQTCEKK
jgi:hypothetical protein